MDNDVIIGALLVDINRLISRMQDMEAELMRIHAQLLALDEQEPMP